MNHALIVVWAVLAADEAADYRNAWSPLAVATADVFNSGAVAGQTYVAGAGAGQVATE